jgi:hypothetical protein
MKSFCRSLSVICVVAVALSPLTAQAQRRPNQNQQNLQTVTIDGKVKGIRGNQLLVTAGVANYLVTLQPNTKVAVNGTAKADFLGTGMFVTFTAKADKQNRVPEPVKSFKMLTPSDVIQAGSQEEGSPEGDLTPMYFAGYIRTKKGDNITMQYGKSPKESVTFTAAEDAEIAVQLVGDVRNVRLLRTDDEVKIIGKQAQAPSERGPGFVAAEDITATLVKPLTNEKPSKDKDN